MNSALSKNGWKHNLETQILIWKYHHELGNTTFSWERNSLNWKHKIILANTKMVFPN